MQPARERLMPPSHCTTRTPALFLALAIICTLTSAWDTPLPDAQKAKSEKLVTFLTNATFWPWIDKTPCALVEFYAPWCPHCQHFRPVWADSAAAIAKDAMLSAKPCKLASVDAMVENKLASKLGVRGYPTIFYFRDSKHGASTFSGGRDPAGIVKFLTQKLSRPPPLLILRTPAEADAALHPARTAGDAGIAASTTALDATAAAAAAAAATPDFALLRVTNLIPGATGAKAIGPASPDGERAAAQALETLSEELSNDTRLRIALVSEDAVLARFGPDAVSIPRGKIAYLRRSRKGAAVTATGSASVSGGADAGVGTGAGRAQQGGNLRGAATAAVAGVNAAGGAAAAIPLFPFPASDTAVYKAEGDATWGDPLKYFIAGQRMPLVSNYTKETSSAILENTIQVQLLVMTNSTASMAEAVQARAALRSAAPLFRGKVLPMVLDASDSYVLPVLKFFGVKPGDAPCAFIADMRSSMKKYRVGRSHLMPLRTRMAPQLQAFVRKFFAGTLTQLTNDNEKTDDDPSVGSDASAGGVLDLKGVHLKIRKEI